MEMDGQLTFEFSKRPTIKGFPELRWTGKRPYESTQYYPAQLKERYGEDVSGWINKIFWGDNLQVMSHLLKKYRGQVDLIYIDPPFDSKADYKKSIKLKGQVVTGDSNSFEEKQYGDIWTNDEYLQFMYERLTILRDLLSETGSIFLHCDYHRNSYLRIIMDELFGNGGQDGKGSGFKNEIIWQRTGAHNDAGKYGIVHDTILWYTKTPTYKFTMEMIPLTDDHISSRFKTIEPETGRRFYPGPITAPGDGPSRIFRGKELFPPAGRHWSYSQENIDELERQNRIYYSSTGVPYLKEYADEYTEQGRRLQSIWTDILPSKTGSEIVELFQDGQATYYGVNTLSGNMIRANRSRLKNPNGLILGTPGSGKSFSVKREILDCFLTTTDDIIVCDPEGEYFPLVQALHGQLIRIASNSEQHINPMDISIDDYLFENPMEIIADKSDFLISLCEIIVGGRYGLSSEERSVIDKCVQRIYKDFIESKPTAEKMPLLSDLQNELKKEGEVALRVSNSLEMFVNGSQNLFNHHTNIDMQNRLICFDIKELGNQLKKVGMLIVQDTVWNRVSQNREKKKITRYYIDEFHLLLKEEQTAKYSAEIWKRFRKWGGVPTGITQNVKDLLQSQEVENIFDNSDFVYMLNQASGDRDILAEKLHISKEQMEYVTNSGPGEGLIRYDKVLLPFTDHFPTNTEMYRLMTTKPSEA